MISAPRLISSVDDFRLTGERRGKERRFLRRITIFKARARIEKLIQPD